MTSKLQGKHAFMQMLRAEGVRYIFGNPGTSEAPFIGILHEYPRSRVPDGRPRRRSHRHGRGIRPRKR